MSEREQFLRALARNEDDDTTRFVYADWLEEHGEDDEAERQRKYPAAKRWLQEFRKRINYEGGEWDDESGEWKGNGDYEHPHSYEAVIQAGYQAVSKEGYCFASDEGADFFRGDQADREDFFRNWSIVTGVAVPEEVVEDPNFHCSC
jgi:uncharacterized protein (TIGR02996 family)